MDASSEFVRKKHDTGSVTSTSHASLMKAIILAMMGLLSCEPDPLEVDHLRFPDTHIVVSSMILRDRSIAVLVTQSMGPLQATDESDPRKLIATVAINDATVTLTTGGMNYTLELWQNGIYRGKGIPLVPGAECDLRVVSEAFGEVSATTTITAPVAFTSASLTPMGSDHHTSWIQVRYSFQDPPSPNYYMVTVQRPKHESDIDRLLQPQAYTHILDDNAFNGAEFSETFTAIAHDLAAGDTLEVSLANVSPDYYNYVNMRMENQLKLAELFSEPVYYPTNIRGGRGFFTLYLSDVKVIVL